MSNETTSPVLKWILIGVIAASFCVVGACVLFMFFRAQKNRVVRELEARGFEVIYTQQGDNKGNIWKYPYVVIGEKLSITEEDCQLLCQLPHLQELLFQRCDLSGLNLDDIGNCRKLRIFYCNDVTPYSADEIRKLTACPIHGFMFVNARLVDSDLEVFANWTKLEKLFLGGNPGITDAGFEYLGKISSLRELQLQGTSVTKEGIEEFKKKRPDVEVYYDGRP